jgi:hypothetical protein
MGVLTVVLIRWAGRDGALELARDVQSVSSRCWSAVLTPGFSHLTVVAAHPAPAIATSIRTTTRRVVQTVLRMAPGL